MAIIILNTGEEVLVDDEDYITVQKREKNAIKGTKCGECGMKFDYGKAYGFHCMNSDCPMQMRITW